MVSEKQKIEQAVMVCPQCEGEGFYADGLDDAACSTECVRCGSNGWIVDTEALTAAEQAEPAPSGYYYPIPMPLDADGKGPASFEEGEVRKLVFEVWDQDFRSHGTFDNLPEAIAHANRLNAPAESRLREALEWYAEQARLCRLIHSGGDAGRNALAKDVGAKARAALAQGADDEADRLED